MSRHALEREIRSLIKTHGVYDVVHAIVEESYREAETAKTPDSRHLWSLIGQELTRVEALALGLR